MKLILHVGMSKTGSTALQNRLANSRKELLKQGVLYPEVSFSADHNFLSLFLRKGDQAPPNFIKKYQGETDLMMRHAESNWLAIKRQVQKYSPHTIILSGESIFIGLTNSSFDLFKARLQELTSEIQVIVYIRKPSAHYLSSIQEKIKSSGIFPDPSPKSLRASIEVCESISHNKPIVVAYEQNQLFLGDITCDFMQRVLPAVKLSENSDHFIRENETLSAESMSILYDFHLEFSTNPTMVNAHHLIRLLRDIEKKNTFITRPKLKVDIADYIDQSSLDLIWLAERYQVIFRDLDYSLIGKYQERPTVELNQLPNICIIDGAIKTKILMQLLDALIKPKFWIPHNLALWIKRNTGRSSLRFIRNSSIGNFIYKNFL